jgi:hypothetical protein
MFLDWNPFTNLATQAATAKGEPFARHLGSLPMRTFRSRDSSGSAAPA